MPDPKLSDTQLVILNAAVQRGDWSLLPVPKSVTAKGGALKASLKSLLDRGLTEEIEGAAPEQAWRQDDDGRGIGLAITDAGLNLLGVERDDPGGVAPDKKKAKAEKAAKAAPAASLDAPRANTKAAQLLDLLQTAEGATIADLTKALSWQAHTVRAAFTGLRKRGYDVVRDKGEDGVTRYHVRVEASK